MYLDVENGLDIFGFDSTINLSEDKSLAVVAEGDGITLTCGASIYNYSSEIQWFYNEELLKPDESKVKLKVKNIKINISQYFRTYFGKK